LISVVFYKKKVIFKVLDLDESIKKLLKKVKKSLKDQRNQNFCMFYYTSAGFIIEPIFLTMPFLEQKQA
jgi:hypothetical protein